MGLFSKAFGIEDKGSLTVSVNCDQLTPGDTVIGQVNLTVVKPFDGEQFVVSVIGKEKVTWETTSRNNDDVSSTDKHRADHDLFTSHVVVIPPQRYEPGVFVYPFQYTLPSQNLPASFDHSIPRLYLMERVRMRILYKVRACLPIHGRTLRKYIKASACVDVRTPAKVGTMPKSIKRSETADVKVLTMLSRGRCALSIKADRDVVALGDTLPIQCHIENKSSKQISRIRARLYEDVAVHLNGKTVTQDHDTSRAVETTGPGIAARDIQDIEIPVQIQASQAKPFSYDVTANLFSIHHHVQVECCYKLCRNASVEFPVTIEETRPQRDYF